jgi:5-carboxymethyl-2-hydroxymuconate isomerase
VPHIIVEYAKQRINDTQVDAMLNAIHHAIVEIGLYKPVMIKTRAYAFNKFTNGGGSEPYIHIQARIKAGRDVDNKKQLSDVILKGLSALNIPASVITVEVIDMERESYGKYCTNS